MYQGRPGGNEPAGLLVKRPNILWDACGTDAHWRNRPDPEQPFFAVFNPTRTHESFLWPEQGVPCTFDPAAIRVPPYLPDTPVVREALSRMYTQVERSDRELGELLRQLDEDGIRANTYVFHWSDHGPLPRGKRWPYDAGIHVPLIVRGPGLDAGGATDALVSTVDLGPTVLSLAGIEVPRHMQGRAFLGEQAGAPRAYVYAARDRHDESYDKVRAVRDRRFKYIRNDRPDVPYLSWLPYLNANPIMQEMWRLHLAGELTGPASLLFQARPVEELYDTESDPYEIRNRARDPALGAVLGRLRAELERWLIDVGDLGEIAESEMVRRWYPDGVQPQTAPPVPVPVCASNLGIHPAPGGAALEAPAMLQLHCATQGASIAFTTDGEKRDGWRLYTGPIRLPPGRISIRACAVRIGYRDSDEIQADFSVADETGAAMPRPRPTVEP